MNLQRVQLNMVDAISGRWRSRLSKWQACDLLRILLGLVLLPAAGLKGYQLPTEPTLEKSLLTSRWFLIAEVEFELVLGVFLLSGLYKRLIWLVTLICFIGFSCVTLYKGLSGQASCGCFGKVEISPWYTLIFDVLVCSALTLCRPTIANTNSFAPPGQSVIRSHWRRLSFPFATILLICLSVGYAMIGFEPKKTSADGILEREGGFVVLEPEKWVGKPFPLMKQIRNAKDLKSGQWVVVLYRFNCPECKEALTTLKDLVRETSSVQMCLISVPPHGEDDPSFEGFPLSLRLNSEKEWLIITPTIVLLQNGRVKCLWQEKIPSLDQIRLRAQTNRSLSYCGYLRHGDGDSYIPYFLRSLV